MNKETPSIPCDNQASNANAIHSAHILEILPCIPFELLILLSGKTARPLIEELTGISASHLRRGKSFELRESTEKRAIENAAEWSREQVLEQGWSEKEWNSLKVFAPSSIASESRPFADFIHGLQLPGMYNLPQATAFAEEVDLIVIRLLGAHRLGDLEAFKKTILECDWLEVDASRQVSGQWMEVLRLATDWEGALAASQQFYFDMLLCLFAALDAEFGLVFFEHFQPRPIFLFVMPRMNPKVDLGSLDNIPKRNFVYQPVRRLLELSHALMVLKRDQCWPGKPVGRKALGEVLDLTDQDVGNFFDGTRNMSAKLFQDLWVMMSKKVANCEPCASPLPLVLAALFWQSTITRHPDQKLKSFILPDKGDYTRFWNWHHHRWASQLEKGSVGWPTWLDD